VEKVCRDSVGVAAVDAKLHDRDQTRGLLPPSGVVKPDLGLFDTTGGGDHLKFDVDRCNDANAV
jgi:hypothetical protein